MIRKRKWLISMICLMGLFLMAFSGSGTMPNEEIDLQHLVTPAGLMAQSKEVYEMDQEAGNI
ncbi:hypothetical protein [Anoxynatronum buryatiense]|uniref:Uncharacterized protein n=1 Tax=Anoxynatronum buryatiense TaxID=489973 RepID=A0AA46AJD0_9CLOT|nr:hypothetical protein [Anoxynatronum buryatiense]SMP60681.1 hypothetical protein SAMN06296020_108165 [Anoxynatronum buryatiense]